MKFFVAFAALVAVAVATPLYKPAASQQAELEAIVAAINSPSTDPATALLLQEMLQQIIGAAVGPALVEDSPPVASPEIIDFPVHEPVDNSPVVIGPVPEGATPLVQIIVNVAGAPGAPGVGADAPAIEADPVNVVDSAPVEEVDAVQVVDLPVSGVEVADLPAQPVLPVQIGNPQLPILPAVLPHELN